MPFFSRVRFRVLAWMPIPGPVRPHRAGFMPRKGNFSYRYKKPLKSPSGASFRFADSAARLVADKTQKPGLKTPPFPPGGVGGEYDIQYHIQYHIH